MPMTDRQIIDSQQVIVDVFKGFRQELLSGIKSINQFKSLKESLIAFDDLPLMRADYELAAEFLNTCRSKGVQGSNTDFLICAVASRLNLPILTTDKDFGLFRSHLNIELYSS